MQIFAITCLQYPQEIREIPFDPRFAIRGLHFDTTECILMKLDAFCQIQPDTIYRFVDWFIDLFN